MSKRIRLALLLLTLLLALPATGAAQAGLTQWLRYDVNLSLQQNSGLTVEEIHQVALVSGATAYQHVIPTDQLNSILNVRVIEIAQNGIRRDYQQANTPAEYTFQILPGVDEQTLELYFPPNSAPSTTFVLQYFVDGALRFYDEGDRLNWRPFGWEAAAPIDSSTITINLPSSFSKEQLIQTSEGVAAEKFVPEGNKVIYKATNVAAGDPLEISLTFPHGVVQGSPPPWQIEADAIDLWRPILQWGSVLLAVLLLAVGLAAVYGWWYLKIRIAPDSAKKTPKYLKSPPGNLSPAIAGVLLDGKTQPRHLMATLVDLASKGAFHIFAVEHKGDEAAEEETTFSFDLYDVDQAKAVQPYETTLYGRIFGLVGGVRKRELDKMRNALYMAVPELKNQVEAEIAKAGYLAENEKVIQRQYAAFGGAGIMMSLVLGLLAAVILAKFTVLVAGPFVSLAIASAAFIVVGFVAPKRTKEGEKEAVRWLAFRHYLKDLDTTAAAKVKDKFAVLLPYAISFGLEKHLVESFAAVDVPIPKWWSIPEEKLPDVSHESAYAWVSTSLMSQAEQPKAERTRTKSVIRRLGGSSKESSSLLKDIQPAFMAFLEAGHEVFSKAPALDENQQVDFDSLGEGKK
jgi:hypothetical protein